MRIITMIIVTTIIPASLTLSRRGYNKKNKEIFVTFRNNNYLCSRKLSYEQLAFDKATGWSRWLYLNEQLPCEDSPVERHYPFGE